MFTLIMCLPFLSFIMCSLLGGASVQSESGLQISICFMWLLIWTSVIMLFISSSNTEITYHLGFMEWFKVFPFNLEWALEINKVTLTMLLLILTISFFVHIFSLNYMGGDPHLSLFMGYLGLFTFFMLILVTSPNLVQLFMGWEGVGVCSYLLINFWSTSLLAAQSAYKAMAVNKVGDMAMLMAMGMITKEMGSMQISLMNCCPSFYNSSLFTLATFLLLMGVMGKSAQVGLHMWLPDAMEGPTPVSALIHAATMVTAGVFLIIKLSPLFMSNNFINFTIMVMGSMTCVMAALMGTTQTDLKKTMAYSTCSQLGYMTLVCGYGYYSVSLFHLFNHGIFKALLFLSAGLVMHTLFNEQSTLKMGLKNISPLGKYGFIMGNLAMMGFPFLTGYYSKDLFLELLAANNHYLHPLWMGYMAASLTCFYSLKLLHASYANESSYNTIFNYNFHGNSFFMLFPLVLLSLGSVILGFILFKTLNLPIKPMMISTEVKLMPMWMMMAIYMQFVFWTYPNLPADSNWVELYSAVSMFANSFYFNEFVSSLGTYLSKPSFQYTYKLMDSQLLEWLSTSNMSKIIKNSSSFTSFYHPANLPLTVSTLIFLSTLIMGVFII